MSPPNIDTISPATGPLHGGTAVSIVGSGLSSASDVIFGDVSAKSFTVVNDSEIDAIAPAVASPSTIAITVSSPNGDAIWFDAFTYEISVDEIFPTSGPVSGGTPVSITGSGLSGAASVLFGDQPGVDFKLVGDDQILVTTPAAAGAGNTDISILTASGSNLYIAFEGFTYFSTDKPNATNSAPDPAKPDDTQDSQPASDKKTPTSKGPDKPGTDPKADSSKTADPKPADTKTDSKAMDPKATDAKSTDTKSQDTKAPADTSKDGSTKTSASPPTSEANYIPGGIAPVPDGKTGLGGTAGTGQGFGVGQLLPGGGGSAPPSNLPYYTDPGLTGQLVQSLINIVQNAASPDALEAQNIILRRIALEGDVIGSRIPPPRNISEIGGYLNMLESLQEKAMRQQTLSGILGVAGPTQPLGWISNTQPLAMVAVQNDRPAVPAQKSFPLTILVRSDFVSVVQAALKTLHSYGAMMPLVSPSAIVLPKGGTGAAPPSNVLFYLGRTLTIAPTAALANPAADPIAILSPPAAGSDYALAARVLKPGTFAVATADVNAVQCTPTSQTVVPLNQAPFVPLAPIMNSAGFYSSTPFPLPANSTVQTWATFNNIAGLIPGVTRLGDELSLLYRQDQIVNSAFAAILDWTWNGATFAI